MPERCDDFTHSSHIPESIRWAIYGGDFHHYMHDFSQLPHPRLPGKFTDLTSQGEVIVLDILSGPHALRSIHEVFAKIDGFNFKGASLGHFLTIETKQKKQMIRRSESPIFLVTSHEK